MSIASARRPPWLACWRALRASRSAFAFAIASGSTFIHGANSTPDEERMPRMTRSASGDSSAAASSAASSAWNCSSEMPPVS